MVRIYLYYDVDGWPYKVIPMHLVLKDVFPKDFEHLIVDSGVNKFFKYECRKEYPEWYLKAYPKVARQLTREYGDSVWIVVPDYPDDYRPNRIPNNAELTLKNIIKFLSEYPDVNWLPVIQARWGEHGDFRRALLKYREVLGNPKRIAIGTLCTTAKLDYALYCCRMARKFFPNSWIHVFGPRITWLKHIKHYINSFDSTAYCKVPWSLRKRANGSVSRKEAAFEFIRQAQKYIGRVEPSKLLKTWT